MITGYVEILLFILLISWIFYQIVHRVLGRWCFLTDWTQRGAVLISGCDSGFGRETAVQLATRDGATAVFAGCYTRKGMAELSDFKCSKLHPIQLDITNPNSLLAAKTAVEQILRDRGIGSLWGIISNAAIETVNAPNDWLAAAGGSTNAYREHLETNTIGTIQFINTFKNLIKESKGRIVIMTSIKGRLVFPNCGPYTVSKWAVEAFADLIRRELYPFGVSVHVMQPGGFQTNLISSVPTNVEKLWSSLSPSVQEEYGQEYYRETIISLRAVRSASQTPNLSPVVNAYREALFSRFPRSRYRIGWDTWFQYYPVSLLSDYLQDVYFRYRFPTVTPKTAAADGLGTKRNKSL